MAKSSTIEFSSLPKEPETVDFFSLPSAPVKDSGSVDFSSLPTAPDSIDFSSLPPEPESEEQKINKLSTGLTTRFKQIQQQIAQEPDFTAFRNQPSFEGASELQLKAVQTKTDDPLSDFFRQRFSEEHAKQLSGEPGAREGFLLSDDEITNLITKQTSDAVTLRLRDQLAQTRAQEQLQKRGVEVDLTEPGSEAQFRDEVRVQRQFLGLSDHIPIGEDPSGLRQIGGLENVLRAIERGGQTGLLSLTGAGIVAPETTAGIQQEIAERLQSNPELAENFILNILPEMGAQTAPIMALGPFAAIGGAVSQAAQGRIEAQQAGASPSVQALNTLGNGIIGAAEGLFFGSAVSGAAALSKGKILEGLKGVIKTAAIETTTEVGQQLSTNELARVLFDYDRALTAGITPEMLAGSAIIGGGAPVVMSGVAKTTDAVSKAVEFIQGKTLTPEVIDQAIEIATKPFNDAVESVDLTVQEPTPRAVEAFQVQEPTDASTSRQEAQDVSQVQPQQEQVQAPAQVTEAQVPQAEKVTPVEEPKKAPSPTAQKQTSPAVAPQKPRRKPKLAPVPTGVKPLKPAKKLIPIEGVVREPTKAGFRTTSKGTVVPDAVGLSRAQVNLNRVRMGQDGFSRPERVTWGENIANAQKQGIPEQADTIASEILSGQREQISADESAGLVLRMNDLVTQHESLTSELKTAKDEANRTSLANKIERVESAHDILTRATDQSGTDIARALAFRRLVLQKSFDALTVRARARKSKGKDLTTKQKDSLDKKVNKAKEKTEAVEKATDAVRDENAQKALDQAKRTNKKKTLKQLNEEADDLGDEINRLLRAGCDDR